MKLLQAIIKSTGSATSNVTRKELIGKSVDMDEELAQRLCETSPDRNGLAYEHSEGVAFYQLTKTHQVLSRSTVGSVEKKDGSRALFTRSIVFNSDQIGGYGNNPVLLLRNLELLGALRLATSHPIELPSINVSNESFYVQNRGPAVAEEMESLNLARAIKIHRCVMLAGLKSPLEFMSDFLFSQSLDSRLQFDFSYGLRFQNQDAANDRYKLEFIDQLDSVTERELAKQQIRVIKPDAQPILTSS